MSPSDHGYVKCDRCGTQRPGAHVAHSAEASKAYLLWLEGKGEQPEMGPTTCIDVAWCTAERDRRGP